MSGGYQFAELVATEDPVARAEVLDFAVELQEGDLRAWERSVVAADRAGKPRPQKPRAAFDLQWCREKSRNIRVKRERNRSYFNQTTDVNPQY